MPQQPHFYHHLGNFRPETVPQQPRFYYHPGNFIINRGVFESAEMSSDMFDEDDSNEILQHDQIKQNVSKENCYLVETTAL